MAHLETHIHAGRRDTAIAVVRHQLDYELSRKLLAHGRKSYAEGKRRLEIRFIQVNALSNCAVGALSLLGEQFGTSSLQVRLFSSHPSITGFLASDHLSAYICPSRVHRCHCQQACAGHQVCLVEQPHANRP